jgi:hypothetical protein
MKPEQIVLQGRHPTLAVILALVAGIQRPDVRRVKRLFPLKHLICLDSCDEHRNDGGFGQRSISRATSQLRGNQRYQQSAQITKMLSFSSSGARKSALPLNFP